MFVILRLVFDYPGWASNGITCICSRNWGNFDIFLFDVEFWPNGAYGFILIPFCPFLDISLDKVLDTLGHFTACIQGILVVVLYKFVSLYRIKADIKDFSISLLNIRKNKVSLHLLESLFRDLNTFLNGSLLTPAFEFSIIR